MKYVAIIDSDDELSKAAIEFLINDTVFIGNESKPYCFTIASIEQAPEPCEDAISKLVVIETIDDCNSDGLKGIFCSYKDGERFKDYIKDLKPVTPVHKKGKWIVNEERNTICCPYCHDKQKIGKDEIKLLNTAFSRFNFCTYCGAEMESENETNRGLDYTDQDTMMSAT